MLVSRHQSLQKNTGKNEPIPPHQTSWVGNVQGEITTKCWRLTTPKAELQENLCCRHKWSLGSPGILWDPNGSNGIRAPCLSHIMREKSHHPHGTAAIQKVTSGSGKSHQGRRITMAQPVSSIIRDLVTSSRSIAHSDDFEGHNKLIHTNSRQLFLLDLKILYWCPASRDHIKPLLVQPQISCNANGLAVANPIGRAMI